MPIIFKKKFIHTTLLLASTTLSACGGGGSTSNTTTDQLTAQEAAELYVASINNQDTLITLAMEEIPFLNISAKTAARDVGNNFCDNYDGSATLAFTDKDNSNTLSTGDTYTTSYNNCTSGNVTYLSGNISGTITNVSGTLPDFLFEGFVFGGSSWSAQQTMTFTNFVVRDDYASSSRTVNGSATVSATYDSTNVEYTSSFSTNNLSSKGLLDGQQLTLTYKNSSFGYVADTSSSTIDHDFTMDFAWGSESASLTFNSNPPFSIPTNSTPTSGVLLVQGAGQPNFRITAQYSGYVLLETDSNNDGLYESSETASWYSLGFY